MDLQREGFLTGGVNAAREWTPAQFCQAVAEMQYAIACRSDGLAHYEHPMYMAASLALDTAIATAYGQHMLTWGPDFTRTVREIHTNSGERIDYCVETATDYLAARDRMKDEAAQAQRVSQYVNAAILAGTSGYWGKHLAGYYPPSMLASLGMVSNLLHEILTGDEICACGYNHAGDKRAAEGYDASREDGPGAQPEGAGRILAIVDQATSDRAVLRHERHATPRGPIDKAAILQRRVDSLLDSGAEVPTPADDAHTVKILRDMATKTTSVQARDEFNAAAAQIEREARP